MTIGRVRLALQEQSQVSEAGSSELCEAGQRRDCEFSTDQVTKLIAIQILDFHRNLLKSFKEFKDI